MRQRQSVNIRQISQNRAEQVGYYRFLDNEKVTVSELERSVADHCQQQVAGLHVLAISDSSEINLQAHVGRLKPFYAVEAKEVNPPPGQQPIHWRLLTTHEVVCLEQALQQDLRIDRKTIICISSNRLKTYPLTSQSKCV